MALLLMPSSGTAQEMYPDRTGKTMYFGLTACYAGNLIGTTGNFLNYTEFKPGTVSGQKAFQPGSGFRGGHVLRLYA
jgi:hypothetical protein